MGSMLQDRGRQAPPQNEIPSKRFKEDHPLIITETEIESSEELTNTLDSMNPINLAARVLSARAQLFHQFQNNRALLHQQQQQKSFNNFQQNFDSQQKLCQLLQFAHFQAYLATMVSRTTKTE